MADQDSVVEEPLTLQRLVSIHTVMGIEDVLDQVDDNEDIGPYRKVITDTLDVVQHYFYLVPKSEVSQPGELVKRPAPTDAVTNLLSELWTEVNG